MQNISCAEGVYHVFAQQKYIIALAAQRQRAGSARARALSERIFGEIHPAVVTGDVLAQLAQRAEADVVQAAPSKVRRLLEKALGTDGFAERGLCT